MFSLRVVFAFFLFLSSIPVSKTCIRTYNEDQEMESTTPYVKPKPPTTVKPGD